MRGEANPEDDGPVLQEKSISGIVADEGLVCRMSFRNGCSVILGRPVRVSNIAVSGEMIYSSVRTRLSSATGTVTTWVICGVLPCTACCLTLPSKASVLHLRPTQHKTLDLRVIHRTTYRYVPAETSGNPVSVHEASV